MEQLALKSLGLIDAAKGKIPTLSNFDINPPHPENITDGQDGTSSGVGEKAATTTGTTVANYEIDLGKLMLVNLNASFKLWGSVANKSYLTYFRSKREVGDAWRIIGIQEAHTCPYGTEPTTWNDSYNWTTYGRYIQLIFVTNADYSQTYYTNINNFRALKLI